MWLSLETEELRKANRLKAIEEHWLGEVVSKDAYIKIFHSEMGYKNSLGLFDWERMWNVTLAI